MSGRRTTYGGYPNPRRSARYHRNPYAHGGDPYDRGSRQGHRPDPYGRPERERHRGHGPLGYPEGFDADGLDAWPESPFEDVRNSYMGAALGTVEGEGSKGMMDVPGMEDTEGMMDTEDMEEGMADMEDAGDKMVVRSF